MIKALHGEPSPVRASVQPGLLPHHCLTSSLTSALGRPWAAPAWIVCPGSTSRCTAASSVVTLSGPSTSGTARRRRISSAYSGRIATAASRLSGKDLHLEPPRHPHGEHPRGARHAVERLGAPGPVL